VLESEDDGWDRVKELVRFAEECGLRREQLGSELMSGCDPRDISAVEVDQCLP
jgi:DNA-binding phage protein